MNRELAILAIEASLKRGTSTPCTWVPDKDAYISEKSAELLTSIIDPISVSVKGETFTYGVKERLVSRSVFAIAKSGTNWLLYVPELQVFSLAFGETPTQLKIIGFATDDALAEWLG